MKFLRFPVAITGVLLVFFFCDSCGNKEIESSKKITVAGNEYTIRASSSREWDAGVAGGGHAPIFIPYVNKNISNAVTIESNGNIFLADGMEEFPDMLSKNELQKIVDNIDLESSPDGKNLLYTRITEKGKIIRVIHRVEGGKMFHTGYYDDLFTADVNAGKDPDWTKIPALKDIAARFFMDTVSIENQEYVFDALLSLKHTNEMDQFALGTYGAYRNSTFYINSLSEQSVWKDLDASWKTKVADRVRVLARDMEENAYSGDTTSYAVDTYNTLIALARNANSTQLYSPLDSVMCRLCFHNEKMFYKFIERFDTAWYKAPAPEILDYLDQLFTIQFLQGNHSGKEPEILTAQNIFDLGLKANNSTMKNYAASLMIKTWPEMENDSQQPNLLSSYFEYLTAADQETVLAKAEKSMDGKYKEEAASMINDHGDCELYLKMKKKYPSLFTSTRSDCEDETVHTTK
ncbi:MAG: hypothetical protein HY064_04795 [Bacteroidetes bacterium]|nr:hypothetical protein [Bacteroidota bacterium]